MVKQDNLAGYLVLRDQVTGTSLSARVSYGLALHPFGGVQELHSFELIRGAPVVKP